MVIRLVQDCCLMLMWPLYFLLWGILITRRILYPSQSSRFRRTLVCCVMLTGEFRKRTPL